MPLAGGGGTQSNVTQRFRFHGGAEDVKDTVLPDNDSKICEPRVLLPEREEDRANWVFGLRRFFVYAGSGDLSFDLGRPAVCQRTSQQADQQTATSRPFIEYLHEAPFFKTGSTSLLVGSHMNSPSFRKGAFDGYRS